MPKTKQSVNLPDALWAEVDAVAKKMEHETPGLEITRTAALRVLVTAGLLARGATGATTAPSSRVPSSTQVLRRLPSDTVLVVPQAYLAETSNRPNRLSDLAMAVAMSQIGSVDGVLAAGDVVIGACPDKRCGTAFRVWREGAEGEPSVHEDVEDAAGAALALLATGTSGG